MGVVRKEGFEPSRAVSPLAPKASASTDSATFARFEGGLVPYRDRNLMIRNGEPRRTRTFNPQIKSLLLCQLS